MLVQCSSLLVGLCGSKRRRAGKDKVLGITPAQTLPPLPTIFYGSFPKSAHQRMCVISSTYLDNFKCQLKQEAVIWGHIAPVHSFIKTGLQREELGCEPSQGPVALALF